MILFILQFLLAFLAADVTAVDVLVQEQSDYLLEQMTIENYANSMTSISDDLIIPEQDIIFLLYTRDNPDEPVILRNGDIESLNNANFSITVSPVKLLIHGWTDSISDSWMHEFRENYLSLGKNYNVILVDWTAISSKDYLIAARLTKEVGDYISQFLRFLISQGLTSPNDIHIIAHSLGAHVAGFIGADFSGRIARITAMDPARIDFEAPILRDPRDRLDPSDAQFVDVIHTCAGTIGFIRAIGHADFYPNGGSFRQPGCPALLSGQYCSHGRSHEYMGESIINPVAFPAVECAGWKEFQSNVCDTGRNRIVFMGERLDKSARGVYFLETNARPPYGRGEL